jgi:TrmH family RNA methyltransferase
MISKAQIGFIKSLDQKKYRNQYKVFFVEGIKLVNELLISEYKLHSLYAVKEWAEENGLINSDMDNKLHIITEKELNKISCLSTPNQVLGIFMMPEETETDYSNTELILCLDSIRDPGNMGTIIRTADWYGINYIVCSEDCVDIFNPKVVQASMGSISRVKADYCNLLDFLDKNPGFNSYAATLSDTNMHSTEPEFPAAIFIGNESQGLSKAITDACKYKISIPKYGKAESLNAAIASAILLDKFKHSFSEFKLNNKR